MVYVFEFFAEKGEERHAIDRVTYRAKSVNAARDQAKAMLKNVKVRDQRPNLCVIKDQMGNTLGEVANG